MSGIQLYLLEADKDKARIAADNAKLLETKELKLVSLITSLEPYLNDKSDAARRGKTLAYLADVLSFLPPKVLSGQERHLLCEFLIGRIEGDVEGIDSSAKALLVLEKLGKWDCALTQRVMKTFLDNINPLRQIKYQSQRFAIVQLINMLLNKYRGAIRQMYIQDPNFMSAFVSFFDGERDPRNLMVIFSLYLVPMMEWDVHAHAQELFEAVFNYFPITFKPPPDDPYKITAQDLKERLRDCITANTLFAPFAFPQLLDKLDSTSLNTKRDVLVTITACIESYGHEATRLYAIKLWDALKFEVLHAQEEDLATESLKALFLLASKLAQVSEDSVNVYLRAVIKECGHYLEDAPTKQSEAAGRILHSVASSSPIVANKIARGIFPTIFTLYNSTESTPRKCGLLGTFNQVLSAYDQGSNTAVDLEALKGHSSEALHIMVRNLLHSSKSDESLPLISLNGLVYLTSIRGLLSGEETATAVDSVTDTVLDEEEGDFRAQAIDALKEIAKIDPRTVCERAIPAFMARLPDVPSDTAKVQPILEGLAQIGTEKQVFLTVIIGLRNKYEAAYRSYSPMSYQRLLLLALLYEFASQENDTLQSSYFTDFAEPLTVDVISGKCRMPDVVGRIVNITLRSQSEQFQKTVGWLQSLAEMVRKKGTSTPSILQHMSLCINKFINPKEMQETLGKTGLEVDTMLSGNPPSPSNIDLAFAVVKALIVQGRSGAIASKYLEALLSLLQTGDKAFARNFSTLLAQDPILTKSNHCKVSTLYKQKTFYQALPLLEKEIPTANPTAKQNYLLALSGLLKWQPHSSDFPPSLTAPLLQVLDLDEVEDQGAKFPALAYFDFLLRFTPDAVREYDASLVGRLLNNAVSNSVKVRIHALQCLGLVPVQCGRGVVVPLRPRVLKDLLKCLDDKKRDVRAEAVRCRMVWLGLGEGDE
ncbi:ARM repeat-containing protein [Piedraia hortae CBS 480.64]|uniref:MMS19 nucleotide excision repair protein n=1 Tax=Piedraia hortae CBS 480.64 TaxID=1314780 RepID=A0A6A7BS67_9PEZI|nr:ARM repeat-containing protein [Piedraia hortae CBS 480.64]